MTESIKKYTDEQKMLSEKDYGQWLVLVKSKC